MKDIIPMFLFFCIAAIILGIAWLRHRERMALIEKGVNPHPVSPATIGTRALFLGLVAVAIGLAMGVSMIFSYDSDLVLPAFLLLFGGAASLLYWKMTAKDRENARRMYERDMERENVLSRELPDSTDKA